MAKELFALDAREKEVKKGDTVLVRHAFPKTAKLSFGVVEKVKVEKGMNFVKLKGNKEYFSSFLKLANK